MRLGELLAVDGERRGGSSTEGTSLPLPRGVSKKVSHQAKTLSTHRADVEKASAKARETGLIPMANEIYKIIMSGARHRRSVYKEYGSARIALRNAQVR